jgi:alcohol dehydrogenase (cytochrome c)
VLCTYDLGTITAFESGLIMVDNALIGTTEFEIFPINPATCAENWRMDVNSAGSPSAGE